MHFGCPVRDQRLVLDVIVRISELRNDLDIIDAVLDGAAALAEGEFAPLDRTGDETGSRWNDGEVTMPPGFHEAYRAFADGGWMGLAAPEDARGQGLPHALAAPLMENLNAANLGFALCPMLGSARSRRLPRTAARRSSAIICPGSSVANGPRR